MNSQFTFACNTMSSSNLLRNKDSPKPSILMNTQKIFQVNNIHQQQNQINGFASKSIILNSPAISNDNRLTKVYVNGFSTKNNSPLPQISTKMVNFIFYFQSDITSRTNKNSIFMSSSYKKVSDSESEDSSSSFIPDNSESQKSKKLIILKLGKKTHLKSLNNDNQPIPKTLFHPSRPDRSSIRIRAIKRNSHFEKPKSPRNPKPKNSYIYSPRNTNFSDNFGNVIQKTN